MIILCPQINIRKMKEQIINILSQKIDKNIVEDLVNSYEEIKNEFINNNYVEVHSKSGKFVENVFIILNFIITNKTIGELKLGDINKISKKLKNANDSKYAESIRLLIPDIARSLIYQPRSKMGAVHKKPVTPDFIDAKLTISASDWIMAELLRQYDTREVKKIQQLINNVVMDHIPIIQKIGEEIFVDAHVRCNEEILIILYQNTNGLTKKEIYAAIKHFDRSTVFRNLKKMEKSRCVFLTEANRYVIAGSAKKRISNRIIELTMLN